MCGIAETHSTEEAHSYASKLKPIMAERTLEGQMSKFTWTYSAHQAMQKWEVHPVDSTSPTHIQNETCYTMHSTMQLLQLSETLVLRLNGNPAPLTTP
ncbi:hypothetical protein Pelo_19465 [Pelomyxa schiedti]|nr:hypothetical protein Pelo_19465 [Pelomyxa schiedti]